jgi:type I restriction enzyme S subunit
MESGIVNQIEHLGRSFAAAETSHYNVGHRFDVVYTKSPLKAFPFGIVKQCKFDGEVALSPLYGVFAPKNPHVGLLIEAYFEAPERAQAFLAPLCQKGAKNTLQITNATFLSGRMALPKEEGEQKKVAECLASADALIEAQGRKLDALKAHKKGLMQQLFPQKGETQPRLRFPEFEGAREWEEGTLSDIGTVLQGYGFPERFQGQQSGDFPFYKVSDISRSLGVGKTFIEEAANYVNEHQLKELKAKPIPAGTTVFAKIGEAIRSNKRAITTVPCLIDNNAAGVKSIRGKATDFFIYLTMEQISLFDHAGGVVPAVNKSAIEAIPVKFPKVEEQQRIADCLTSLDDLIAAEIRKHDTLKAHKKGLMQQLFPLVEEDDA